MLCAWARLILLRLSARILSVPPKLLPAAQLAIQTEKKLVKPASQPCCSPTQAFVTPQTSIQACAYCPKAGRLGSQCS